MLIRAEIGVLTAEHGRRMAAEVEENTRPHDAIIVVQSLEITRYTIPDSESGTPWKGLSLEFCCSGNCNPLISISSAGSSVLV